MTHPSKALGNEAIASKVADLITLKYAMKSNDAYDAFWDGFSDELKEHFVEALDQKDAEKSDLEQALVVAREALVKCETALKHYLRGSHSRWKAKRYFDNKQADQPPERK